MDDTQMEKKPRTRRLPKILLAIAALFVAALLVVLLMFQRELRTLGTLTRMGDTSLFTMDYIGDYGFDDFLTTGASTDGELVGFVAKKLLKGLPMDFDLPDLGCSTFAVATPEGDALFGRNFDMYYSPALFVRTAPTNGYRSISMVNLSYIGYGADKLPTNLANSFLSLAAPYIPLDGVNEKGVAVGVLLIDTDATQQVTEKVDITTTTAIRLILDKAATVEEALALLSQYDMHASANSCYHFQIADATGKSVVVEYIGDEMVVVESRRATNFLLTPGDWDFGGGQDRFATLETTMTAKNNVFTAQEAMALLASVRQAVKTDKTSTTQWSCVYHQATGSVDIAVGMDYDNIYHFPLTK